MSLVVFGIAAIGLLLVWLIGGLVLRLSGLVLALAGLTGLALSGNANGILVLILGGFLWLVGHWHYALRHHAYKSPLARYVFCRWAPAWLDPARNWAVPVVDPEPANEERRPT